MISTNNPHRYCNQSVSAVFDNQWFVHDCGGKAFRLKIFGVEAFTITIPSIASFSILCHKCSENLTRTKTKTILSWNWPKDGSIQCYHLTLFWESKPTPLLLTLKSTQFMIGPLWGTGWFTGLKYLEYLFSKIHDLCGSMVADSVRNWDGLVI